MTFEQLLYASELANHHSLQKTAALLHISKSGLSQAISQLEGELGVTLFDRTPQGSVLTPAGQALLPGMHRLLDQQLALAHHAAALGPQKGVERLTMAYPNTLLKPFWTVFERLRAASDHPLELRLQQLPAPEIISRVRQQEVTLGFLAINDSNRAALGDLALTPVHQGHLTLMMAPDHPLAKLDQITAPALAGQPFVLFNDPYNDQVFAHLQYLCGPLPVVVKTDDAWAAYQAAVSMQAVILGRDWQAIHAPARAIRQLVARRIGNLVDDRFTLGWLTNPARPLSPLARQYQKQVTAALRKRQPGDSQLPGQD